MSLIGIDIGGTKICVCVGNQNGKIVASKRIATAPIQGFQEGLRQIEALIHELCLKARTTPQAIGISCPGPISSKEGKMLTPPNLPGWENAPLVSYFKKAFSVPIQMNNDANAAAVAEYEFGGEKGTKDLIYLTCSTGMGGGAIVGGKLVQGVSDTAAEVGHFVLDIAGPLCPCGQRGCFEAYCGGAALAKQMQEEIGSHNIKTLVLEEAQGKLALIDAKALIGALKKGDDYAQKIWDNFILRLAQGIGTVLMNYNPEALILGTIAIHSGPLLLEPLHKMLPRFAWKQSLNACRITASKLGDKISELSGIALARQALSN